MGKHGCVVVREMLQNEVNNLFFVFVGEGKGNSELKL